MNTIELMKCPCCGSNAVFFCGEASGWYSVECSSIACSVRTPYCATDLQAAAIWNNRYVEKPQDERVKYALMRLEENGFEARCVNDSQGLIHCYDRDGELVCYYATTGKIQGSDKKGILRLLDRLRGYNV